MFNPVVQTRFVIENIKDPKCGYNQVRENVNVFLETHKSTSSLDVCLEDIRHDCSFENIESIDDLILKMSFQETALSVIVIFMQDAGVWNKTISITKEEDDDHYTVYDPSVKEPMMCQSLDVDVYKRLSLEPVPSFGYLVLFLKQKKQHKVEEHKVEEHKGEEPKGEEPVNHAPPSSAKKKRYRPVAIRKKITSAVSEVTSEESTNK